VTNYDYPANVIADSGRGTFDTLLDDDGDVLPIVDAFCKGYAEAILFANAYHYVSCDIHTLAAPIPCVTCARSDNLELIPDENAQYAYQGPGKWWEGIGIDFTDAIDFLAANVCDLTGIVVREVYADENRYLAHSLIHWNAYEQHGHDFALTRNHHGTGFWDRGYGDVGDRLTQAAQAYGEHSVLTDDGPTVTTL